MVRDGIPFVLVPLVLAIVAVLLGYWPVWLGLLLIAAFMAFFFRDPHRAVPSEPGIVLAPADGRITIVRHGGPTSPESLVSIFLSPLDVHVNRSPIAGEITEISYKRGKFLIATNERSSLLNEQNTLTIKGADVTVKCTQIAGIVARRIVCWKRPGERVECGERFGMIRFGSRTDLLLPPAVEVVVEEGMQVRAGVTIVGKIKK